MRFAGSASNLLNTIDFASQVPSYDLMSGSSTEGRSLERRAQTEGRATVAGAGLNAHAQIAAAEAGAAATVANGQAAMWGSIGSGIANAAGSIGSGLINRPPGGGMQTFGTPAPPAPINGTQMYNGQLLNTGMVTV